MNLLNGEQILKACDKKTVEVDVPEWGKDAKVLIGSMGALDSVRFYEWMEKTRINMKENEEDQDEQFRVVTTDSPSEKGQSIEKIKSDETNDHNKIELPLGFNSIADFVEYKIRYCLYSILDPKTFQPCFTLSQLESLGSKSMDPINRIYKAAISLDAEDENSKLEFKKNSERTFTDGSGGD